VRFLIDAQLPPGMATRLEAAGHQAAHLYDVLEREATDLEVVAEANRREAILVSKDEDFADLSRRRVLPAPFLWIRCGNVTNVKLWQVLEPLLPMIAEAFASGEKIIEIR
jgi:predicted nuclease of predicted toxin-antitoxin system